MPEPGNLAQVTKLLQAHYDRGTISRLELVEQVVEHIDGENVRECLALFLEELVQDLRARVDLILRSAVERAGTEYIYIGNGEFKKVSEARRLELEERYERSNARRGIEALRNFFGDPKMQWSPEPD
jgi:hypothetical protein